MVETRKISAYFLDRIVVADNKGQAQELYDKSRFGELNEKKIQYSLVEALYLIEKGKLAIKEDNKVIKQDDLIKKAQKLEKDFWVKYIVFRDMRNRGYIVKTALKFGADFRVYDRGIKPGEDHAKWVLYPVSETKSFTWYNFSAMNRVAHSTRKNLLVGIVDSENDITYYVIEWTKP